MDQSRKNESVTHESEVIVPLDPAHEGKPTLVERERIEKEQAEKEENQLIKHGEERGCPLPDEDESGPGEEGTIVRKTKSGKERRP
jgi:hypothetical protein